MDIGAIRKEYSKKSLTTDSIDKDPLKQFQGWFEEAVESKIMEPNAMTLSTINQEGFPTGRVVLLKDLDDTGFVFYTNYQSNKGVEMEKNKKVSLTFFWAELERQVRILGECVKVDAAESDEYFASRPRGSQIGAWVSPQSQPIPGRDYLENMLADMQDRFEGQEVKRPKYWGGYRVIPRVIEFWQGRPNRLHDRLMYTKLPSNTWDIKRLAP